jgi:hypothetical protein
MSFSDAERRIWWAGFYAGQCEAHKEFERRGSQVPAAPNVVPIRVRGRRLRIDTVNDHAPIGTDPH